MKSFLRGLKNVGKFITSPQTLGMLGLAAQAAPIPGLGLAVSILQGITKIEARHLDDKGQSGPQKAADFMADFEDGVATSNIFLAQKGKRVIYDPVKLAAARDAMVAAANAARDAQDSMEIIDIDNG